MNGIVLLDDEQQRALSRRSVRINERTISAASSMRRRMQSDAQTTVSNASTDPRSIATLGDDASIADLGSSPRTNFSGRQDARSRRIPPPIDIASIQEDGDPWMYDDGNESVHGISSDMLVSQDMSMKLVLASVVVGVALGLILQALKVSPVVFELIGMPCQLFLRALACIVVPYVFCSVAVAIGDIVYVGKISIVGFQTARIFVTFWLATTIMGMSMALIFRPLLHGTHRRAPVAVASVTFNCANDQLLTAMTNGSVTCATNQNATGEAPVPASTSFVLANMTNTFAPKSMATMTSHQTLEELLRNVILQVVAPNLFTAFTKNELLPVIVAAMVLGSIAGRNYFNKTRRVNYIYLTLLQTRNAFFLIMEWTIALTPVAIASFIASFMPAMFSVIHATNVYFYMLAVLCAALIQTLILLPGIVLFMTQCNPYNYMKHMTRAYLFAFACSSTVATMPVSIGCLKRARACSQSLSNFVVSIGSTSNTSAAGFYVPIAVMFLAETSLEDTELTPIRFVGLFALSLVACIATPPVPAAGLGIVSSVYTAVFSVEQVPPSFMSIVVVEFIVERMCMVCNVNDDLMAVKIIAENTDETIVQEYLGERM